MKLTLVAAVAKNNVIGSHNALPWYIPEDLKHFKQVTTGKTVLMGRNTFESIMDRLKKPLPVFCRSWIVIGGLFILKKPHSRVRKGE